MQEVITAPHNNSSKHRFQSDSVKIIYECKLGCNTGVKKQRNCVCGLELNVII
jgi:hypothetical protein